MTVQTGRPATLLLIEDDPADQRALRFALDRSKFCNRLLVVEDGQEALDYLHRRGAYADADRSPRPDLILLDLNLPKVDGKDVLRDIKATPDLRGIPVVVLTVSDEEEDVTQSYGLGVNSFVRKPVDRDALVETVLALGKYWLEVVVLPPPEVFAGGGAWR